jgi:hypothetical protein
MALNKSTRTVKTYLMTTKKTATKKTTTKRKKTRKKFGYHTGTHNSPKCKIPINYRSGWELTVCKHLDLDSNVIAYTYETIEIRYTSNKTTKRLRKYIPDFVVWYKDGSVRMVEVKRENQLTNPRVQRKAEAAREWCEQQNPKVLYEFWTDKIVLPLQKIHKAKGI